MRRRRRWTDYTTRRRQRPNRHNRELWLWRFSGRDAPTPTRPETGDPYDEALALRICEPRLSASPTHRPPGREVEILQLVGEGLRNAEIARRLPPSPR